MIARITVAQGYVAIGVGIAFAGICIAVGLLAIAEGIRRRY